MRLMLGTKDHPSLLVDVEQEKSPTEFDFWVVNGAWNGSFTNGHITIRNPPGGSWSTLDIYVVLCYNQDRLRGDYQEVFYNFDNPNYVAPKREKVELPSDYDDDIPF